MHDFNVRTSRSQENSAQLHDVIIGFLINFGKDLDKEMPLKLLNVSHIPGARREPQIWGLPGAFINMLQ
jgi:hypothetical protein